MSVSSLRPQVDRPPAAPDTVSALIATDHKRIATRGLWVALALFIGAGIMALLMRLELAQPGLQFFSYKAYNELFTMHGSTMIYQVVTPVALLLCVYLVPLQVGATSIAAPRLALTGLWLYIGGAVVMEMGWLTYWGPGRATWIGVFPLSGSVFEPGNGMDFWLFGVILSTMSQWAWAACVLATALRKRAPGMTLLRMPVFTWTAIATCLLVLFSFPSVWVDMILLWITRTWGGALSGNAGALSYQQMFWFFGHPVVYVMWFPFLGASAEALAINAGRRWFGYNIFVFSILTFTALSVGAYGHHMFTTGQVADNYFTLTTTMILVVAGIEYFDAAATLIGGRLRLNTAMLFALGFFLQFLVGGITGIYMASATLDFHINNSYFIVAHFHYTLFLGSVFGFFAGVYLWFPKMSGFRLREGLGKAHFWLLVIGANMTFMPMFFFGHGGMTRRVADYPKSAGWGFLNTLSTVGAYIIALAILVFLVNLLTSYRRRAELRAGPDPWGPEPWGGHSLEWATTSPPPRHNFDALPPVRSYAPLWDLRHDEDAEGHSGGGLQAGGEQVEEVAKR